MQMGRQQPRKTKKLSRHYWLTPPEMMKELMRRFKFTCDPCPYPLPKGFDGLTRNWGKRNCVNPPFGVRDVRNHRREKGERRPGITAFVRKSICEYKKGKDVVLALPLDKWIWELYEAGAKIERRRIDWIAIEDRTARSSMPCALFILQHKKS
jgi:hypothetical protein